MQLGVIKLHQGWYWRRNYFFITTQRPPSVVIHCTKMSIAISELKGWWLRMGTDFIQIRSIYPGIFIATSMPILSPFWMTKRYSYSASGTRASRLKDWFHILTADKTKRRSWFLNGNIGSRSSESTGRSEGQKHPRTPLTQERRWRPGVLLTPVRTMFV